MMKELGLRSGTKDAFLSVRRGWTRLAISISFIVPILGAQEPPIEAVTTIPTNGRNIYRLAASPDLIVGTSYDDRVCAFSAKGKHLWDATTGGFVFDLAISDLDGDGAPEIITGGADGMVSVFDRIGKLRWKYDMRAPVWQVSTAKLDGKNSVVLATGVAKEIVALSPSGEHLTSVEIDGVGRMMRAGDLKGNGSDIVAVLPVRAQAKDIQFFQGMEFEELDEKVSGGGKAFLPNLRRKTKKGNTKEIETTISRTKTSLKKANGTIADLDGDGVMELIYSSEAISLKSGLEQRFALPGIHESPAYDSNYNMRELAVGNLTDDPGNELVILDGPFITLCDSSGQELGEAMAPMGFTSVAYLPGIPHGSILLGSSPNGGDNLYQIRFVEGWQTAFAKLDRRGIMQTIGENLERITKQAQEWKGEPMLGAEGPFDIVSVSASWTSGLLSASERWIDEVRGYEARFPYPRLRFSTSLWMGEDAAIQRPDGRPWARNGSVQYKLTRQQMIDVAKKLEDADCHFWVYVGHGCTPNLSLETVAALVEAAPNRLLGFLSAEDSASEEMPYYFQHFIRPILELCKKRGKRFIPHNKNVWWAVAPANPVMQKEIFNGQYRSVIVPSVEDSNSRSAEVNLAARVGLWLDGQVDDWASRCAADWFGTTRAWEWEYPMTGHPQLRYYTSQALLGARVFMMLNGEREKRSGQWTRVGLEGATNFLHLLGKGILTPPRREQLRSISPLLLSMPSSSERFQSHGANSHLLNQWMNDKSDAEPWAFDRLDSYWAMAPLPATDVARGLWGRTRRDAFHLPVTGSRGFVCLLPGPISSSNARWSEVWTSDGDHVWKTEHATDLRKANSELQNDLITGQDKFPFLVTGEVFQKIIEQSPGDYVIGLVDPGWLNPADRKVSIAPQIPGNWIVKDRLTGESLGNLSSKLTLVVPAGSVRILDVRQ